MSAAIILSVATARAEAPIASTGFKDDGGRPVSLPSTVTRLLPAGPPASIDLLMIAPEKLVGLTTAIPKQAAPFLPERFANLPALGRLTGRGNTVNLETVLKSKPDLIVDLGYVSPTFISLADRVQEQTNVPYALIAGDLAGTAQTLRKLGALVGASARAETLAKYADDELTRVKSAVAQVPADKRPSVYVARGPRGLETSVAGSINSEAFDFVGAHNVATPALGARGIVNVSMEQILAWKPDVVIVIDPSFYKAIWTDPEWSQTAAVQNKRVYLAPALPYGWVDEPPAANRLIGIEWLAKVLYPSQFPEDIRADVKTFYGLFYQQEPSEPQLDQLLASAPEHN